jgi:isocitrate/isopropylmalate dehydrogenase
MLDHLGESAAAERIDKAVAAYLAERLPGSPFPSTGAVGDAIAERV